MADAARKLMALFQFAYNTEKVGDNSEIPPITLTDVATDSAAVMVGAHPARFTFDDEAGFLGAWR